MFESPDFKDFFTDKPNIHVTLAAEVLRYLLGMNDDRDVEKLDNKEEVLLAKQHTLKWADDVMKKDIDLCEFVIQTNRMEMIFQQFFNGTDWILKDEKGKKVSVILTKYGGLVPQIPSPENYKKLVERWITWQQYVKKQGVL